MQSEPFKNFSFPPYKLQVLKKKHHVILRLTNGAAIENSEHI
jgi:hypothetical protein